MSTSGVSPKWVKSKRSKREKERRKKERKKEQKSVITMASTYCLNQHAFKMLRMLLKGFLRFLKVKPFKPPDEHIHISIL